MVDENVVDDITKRPRENLVEVYYDRLVKTKQPAFVLGQLYRDILRRESVTQVEVAGFNELIRTFGRFNVFFAIVAIGNKQIEGNPQALLFHICRDRLERKYSSSLNNSYISLDEKASEMADEIKRQKKIKVNLKGIDG